MRNQSDSVPASPGGLGLMWARLRAVMDPVKHEDLLIVLAVALGGALSLALHL